MATPRRTAVAPPFGVGAWILPCALLLALQAGLATAEPVQGVYVGAAVGGNFHDSTRSGATTVGSDPGLAGVGALGVGFGNGVRAEVEGSYRENAIDTLTVRSATGTLVEVPGSGRIQSYGFMANLLYGVDLKIAGTTVQPYVGAGLGVAWSYFDQVSARTNFALAGTGGQRRTFDGSDSRFAWQMIGGIALPVASMPGVSITGEYRYMATAADARVPGRDQATDGTLVSASNNRFASENHMLMVGVRYAFGQAPRPPAPAAPQAAPATPPTVRTFLVFFDIDRADLTERARQIIEEAAQTAMRTSATRIEVAGHADTAGSAEYNARLSRRRAEAVAAELVRRGVPRNEISVSAFGETRVFIPTGDAVREGQNRRVQIVLR